MQIVIDIDDNLYAKLFDNGVDNYDDAVDMAKAIRKGMPLPKGHGKIIDVDQFYKAFNEYLSERKSFSFADLETILNVVTPPILKADKEMENESDN